MRHTLMNKITRQASNVRASIDLGTTKVSAMIAQVENGEVRLLGAGTAPVAGMRQGVVVDIEQASKAIRAALNDAEQMAGMTVKRLSVGAAGEHIRSLNSRGVVSIDDIDAEITSDDVVRVIDASRSLHLPPEREILHTIPGEYIVDNQRGIRHPAGMFGSRLEARVHIVTAARAAIDNIAKAVDLAGAELEEIVFEPLASAAAVLSPDEREMGVMLLDIGGGTTDVLIASEDGIQASGVIGLGGNNITSDVAYGLRTSQRHAEEIKVRHGCALSSMVGDNAVIEVNTLGANENRRLAKQMLSGIIEPRVTELFGLIDKQIEDNGLKSVMGAGVVLTGGTAMLKGIRELAEQVFDLPVRVGNPSRIQGLSEVVQHPRFATGVGLLYPNHDAEETLESRSRAKFSRSFVQLKRAIASFI